MLVVKIKELELLNLWTAPNSIPEPTLWRWQKVGAESRKSGRGSKYEELESSLFEKFMGCRSEGVSINKQFLLKEARLIARKKGIGDFLGINSWLDGMKRQSNIFYRRPTRVSQKLKPDSEGHLKEFQKKYIKFIHFSWSYFLCTTL